MFWERVQFVYKRLIIFSCLCLLCGLFLLSHKQIRMWESMDTFYRTAYRMYPNQSVYVLDGLVSVAILNKDYDLALFYAQKMLTFFPNFHPSHAKCKVFWLYFEGRCVYVQGWCVYVPGWCVYLFLCRFFTMNGRLWSQSGSDRPVLKPMRSRTVGSGAKADQNGRF